MTTRLALIERYTAEAEADDSEVTLPATWMRDLVAVVHPAQQHHDASTGDDVYRAQGRLYKALAPLLGDAREGAFLEVTE